jgi:glutathione synthase/RimK-type ligase-like ATP-grasp enzyme
MKKRIALITWSGLPQGAESERLMLPYLAAAGIKAEIVDWRSVDCDFGRFDLLILRTCWDYHLNAKEFTAWLQRTVKVVPVLNAIETVLWNHNKFYLRELQQQGHQIAPTVFVCETEPIEAGQWNEVLRWEKIVVKPAVSATAHKTWLFDRATLPDKDELKHKMQDEALLIQEFIPEIVTGGELSFIYIDGRYSHAVLKRAAAGDFRVQKDFGGTAEPFTPSRELLNQADEIAATVPQVRDSLYCRIDAGLRESKLLLMELELIEPELFLGLAEGAAERFAKAIVRRTE